MLLVLLKFEEIFFQQVAIFYWLCLSFYMLF